VYVFGFFWGVINSFVCGIYVVKAYKWFRERRPGMATVFVVLWYMTHVLIVIPIILVLWLGPFFGPSAALRPAQRVRFLFISLCRMVNH
jgi:drug/metabolite transporter (DMT)-like permease